MNHSKNKKQTNKQKKKQRKFKNLKKQEKQNIFTIYELDKACSQHDIPYEDFKDLAKRTTFEKVLIDKVFKIASNPEYDGSQRGLASMVYKFLIKNPQLVVLIMSLSQINNLQINLHG